MNKEDENQNVKKLIAFFKTLQQKKPAPDHVDYASWDQTEEDYQRQQADWLGKIKQKQQQLENKHADR